MMYDVVSGVFTEVTGFAGATGLQLAFGSDGKLYGHRTFVGTTTNPDGQWYEVDPVNKELTLLFKDSSVVFNDLASGYVSVWNPGDCEKIRYVIRNTGTKNIRLRMSLSGAWTYNWDWLWQNWDALCFSEYFGDQGEWETLDDFLDYFYEYEEVLNPVTISLCEGEDDWLQVGNYFYYIGSGPIGPAEEAGLCLKVCLSGPAAGNLFQGGQFLITARFEAVQSSNYAPYHQWDGVTHYGTP